VRVHHLLPSGIGDKSSSSTSTPLLDVNVFHALYRFFKLSFHRLLAESPSNFGRREFSLFQYLETKDFQSLKEKFTGSTHSLLVLASKNAKIKHLSRFGVQANGAFRFEMVSLAAAS
jgi:hypothetical protein